MNKLYLYLLVTVLLSSLCFAETYQVNTTITFYSDLYNSSVIYNDTSITATTFIRNSSGFIINSGAMTLVNNPYASYTYNATINTTGDYYRGTNYYLSGGLIAQSSETFRIVTNINNVAQDTQEAFEMVFSTFILFLVGFSIVVLAKWLKETVFYFFASTYFMGSSAYMVFDGQGWSFPMFFALFGLVLMYKGISEYLYEVDMKNKNKNINQYDDIE